MQALSGEYIYIYIYGYVHKPPRKKWHIIILPPYPFHGRPYPCRGPEIKNCQTRSLSTNLWDRSGTYKPNHCNMMCVGADLYLTGSARHLPAAENKIPLMPPFLIGLPCIDSAIRRSPPVPVPGNPQRGPSPKWDPYPCRGRLYPCPVGPPGVARTCGAQRPRDDGGECTCWRPPRTRALGSKKNKSQPERSDLRKKYKGKPIKSKPNVIKTYKMSVPVPRMPYPCLYPFRRRLN